MVRGCLLSFSALVCRVLFGAWAGQLHTYLWETKKLMAAEVVPCHDIEYLYTSDRAAREHYIQRNAEWVMCNIEWREYTLTKRFGRQWLYMLRGHNGIFKLSRGNSKCMFKKNFWYQYNHLHKFTDCDVSFKNKIRVRNVFFEHFNIYSTSV